MYKLNQESVYNTWCTPRLMSGHVYLVFKYRNGLGPASKNAHIEIVNPIIITIKLSIQN